MSRSSRHEAYSETSISGTAGSMSSVRASSRLESSSARYSSAGLDGDVASAVTESSSATYLRGSGGRSSITESSSTTTRSAESAATSEATRTQAAITGKRRPSFVKTIEGAHCERKYL